MSWWRDRPFECTRCDWQGMHTPSDENICPECGANLERRTWRDTWGVTIVILSVVVAAVLFVAYFGNP